MPYIDVIQPDEAEGHLKEIYDGLVKSRGKTAEVHKIQSLNPETITRHMDLYMTIMFGKSPLRRVHREMMAVIVSISNRCQYCQIHHLEAVKNFWKDDEKLKAFQIDFETASLDEKEKALCRFAKELTEHPEKSHDGRLISQLKNVGLNDREILDATLVISYFNFVNRIVLGLGVNLEENPGGYKYD
ncbi:peroxidase-related enzyme [Ekhidna sp.]|uniref:peroxidase-related enzyme n=1 Tax=Ekhidna sp. TaxID=2608089 RepID=UPI003CCBB00A